MSLNSNSPKPKLACEIASDRILAGRLADGGGNLEACSAHELAPGKPVLIAVNQDMAGADTPIRSGDTVALMPPVTGG